MPERHPRKPIIVGSPPGRMIDGDRHHGQSGPVTYGPPPQPSWQPMPAPRKKPNWKLFGWITAGLLVLCCGGFGAIGALTSDDKPTPGVTTTVAVQPLAADPTTVEPAVVESSPAVTPSPTPSPSKAKPKSSSRPPTTKPTTSKPKTSKPKTKKPTTSSTQSGVHPGAFCSPEGAYGTTNKGTLVQCTSKDGDQARWRKA